MNERLSWSEAEAVVRRFRAEHGISTDIDVETLAQSLGTDVDEIRRLARPKRRFTDRSGVISAGLAFSVVALAALAFGPSFLAQPKRFVERTRPSVSAITTAENGQRIVIIGDKRTIYFEHRSDRPPLLADSPITDTL